MNDKKTEYSKLTKEEEEIIVNKGTELPFTGKYYLYFLNNRNFKII